MQPMIKIELHDTGAAVEDVQQRLAALGYLREEQVTGTFGDVTAGAVRAFQEVFGLPATGVADYPTWYQISRIYVGVSRIAEPD